MYKILYQYIIYLMGDKIVNFYDKLGINNNANLPTTWDNHHIIIIV